MSISPNSSNIIPLHAEPSDSARHEIMMKEQLERLPKVLRRVRDSANDHLNRCIQNLFDHVDDALFELADRAASNLEQNVFFESMREIRIHRRRMEKSFLDHIDQSFIACMGEEQPPAEQPVSFSLGTDDLAIVSKEELEELVAIDSCVNKAFAQNKRELSSINRLMGTLTAATLSEHTNPVSPRILADAFVDASVIIEIDIKAKLVLFKLFERYVINELTAVLKKVSQVLSESGVQAPTVRAQAPRPPASTAPQPTHSMDQSKPSAVAAEPVAQGGLYSTLQSLLQAHQSEAPHPGFLDTSYASQGENAHPVADVPNSLINALSQLQQQDIAHASTGVQPELLTSNYIQSAIQNATGQQLVDDRSKNVIKLVDMLFSFILEDGNLPDPVKLLLSRLQIPYIKVAVADADFFNKEGHPARRLLNEMATASIGWMGDVESTRRDPLLSKIESTVTKILTEFESNFEIFTLLLTDFIAFQEKERRRAMLFEKRAIDAEDGKAKAEVGRQRVDEVLAKLVHRQSIPDVFNTFLFGPWSNILFLVYMRQGYESKQWNDAYKVAKQLIWSTLPIENEQHQLKLTKLVPALKGAIKAGLDDISFNPSKQSRFFEKFEAYYNGLFEAYKNPKVAEQPVLDTSADSTIEQVADALASQTEAEPQQQAMTARPKPAQDLATEEQPQEIAVDYQYTNLVDNFTVGIWFEKIDQGSSSYRCRLAAIIRGTGKYIFVNRAGVKVAEETRDTLAMQLQQGKMRTLDDGMLFDRALESVITSLRQPR
ncbi:MAG: DUF1631 domain-containing protein [Pseudomonadota bacterium]